MVTKFDQQQFQQMKQSIKTYENEKHSLDTLLALTQSLEKLLNSLQAIEDPWKEIFRTEWWELEFTVAVMVDDDRDLLTQEDEEAVLTALTNIKEMIDKIESI